MHIDVNDDALFRITVKRLGKGYYLTVAVDQCIDDDFGETEAIILTSLEPLGFVQQKNERYAYYCSNLDYNGLRYSMKELMDLEQQYKDGIREARLDEIRNLSPDDFIHPEHESI